MRLLACAFVLIVFGVAPTWVYAECPPNAFCGVKGPDERPKPSSDGAPLPSDFPVNDEEDDPSVILEEEIISPSRESPAPDEPQIPASPDSPNVTDTEDGETEMTPAEIARMEREKRELERKLRMCADLLVRLGGTEKGKDYFRNIELDWCLDALSSRPSHRAVMQLHNQTKRQCERFSKRIEKYEMMVSDPRLENDEGAYPPLVERIRKGQRYCEKIAPVKGEELPRFIMENGTFRQTEAGYRIREVGEEYLRRDTQQIVVAEKTAATEELVARFRTEGRLTEAEAAGYLQRAHTCQKRSEEMLRSVFEPQPYADMVAANGCIVSVLREVKETPEPERSTPAWMWAIIGAMTLLLGALGYQGMIRWGAEIDFPTDGDHSS